MVSRIDPYRLIVGDNPESIVFLRAGGDMPEFGIHEEDYIVVDRQGEALDGKLVVAKRDDELRIMRLVRENGAFLESDGKRMEITGREHVYIFGVVKWILREA